MLKVNNSHLFKLIVHVFRLLICLVILLPAASIAFAGSYAKSLSDASLYLIEFDAEKAGEETSETSHNDLNHTISSSVNLNLIVQKTSVKNDFKAVLTLDDRFKPTHYYLKGILNNREVNVEATISENSVSMTGRKITVHSENLVILDNMVTEHYTVLLKKYKTAGKASYHFYAFIPQVMMEIPAVMEFKKEVKAVVKDSSMILKAYAVTIGSTYIEIWADKENRPVRVMLPAQKLSFTLDKAVDIKELSVKTNPLESMEIIKEEATFKSGGVTLSGEIKLPGNINGRRPGILFLSGSGSQDRNGKSPSAAVDIQTGRILSQLAKAGYAVMSFDDRGIGASKNCCKSISFSDECQDAEAAFEYLSRHKHVEGRHIFLIGHSAGAIAASKLAAHHDNVDGVVLMAAPGRPLHELLVIQNEKLLESNNITGDQRTAALNGQQSFFNFVRNYKPGQDVPQMYKPYQSGLLWFKELLDHDPLLDYTRLTCSVLILQGEKDVQVFKSDAMRIVEMMKNNGRKNIDLKLYSNLDHLFMPADKGNPADYHDKDRSVSSRFINDLTQWVSQKKMF